MNEKVEEYILSNTVFTKRWFLLGSYMLVFCHFIMNTVGRH